jgi:flagellar protein FlaG
MDITRITSTDQGVAGLSAPQPTRQLPPQVPAAAAPVVPANGVRVDAQQPVVPAAISQAELTRSLEAINHFLQPVNSDITFSQDDQTGKTIVKIVDTKTQTLLRQIPSEEAVELAKQLDKLQGLLLRDKA